MVFFVRLETVILVFLWLALCCMREEIRDGLTCLVVRAHGSSNALQQRRLLRDTHTKLLALERLIAWESASKDLSFFALHLMRMPV